MPRRRAERETGASRTVRNLGSAMDRDMFCSMVRIPLIGWLRSSSRATVRIALA
jgi:hypothetical protein